MDAAYGSVELSDQDRGDGGVLVSESVPDGLELLAVSTGKCNRAEDSSAT